MKGFIWLAFTVSQKLSGRLCVGVNGSRASAAGANGRQRCPNCACRLLAAVGTVGTAD